MANIVGIDPGGTTGLAIYSTDNNRLVSLELGPEQHHLPLLWALKRAEPSVIAYERWDYRSHKKHAELTAVEYIGIIKLYAVTALVPVTLEPQQQLKGTGNSLWDDNKLRILGLHKSTPDGHANDAVRQILHYVTQSGNSYWVERYGEMKNAN